MAHLLREEGTSLPLVLPDEEAVATVQLWSRLREDVVADMTRVRNRLHALLLLCDPTYKTHIPDLTTRTGIRACQAYTAPGQTELARQREQAVQQVAAQLALLADQEHHLHQQLEDAVAQRYWLWRAVDQDGVVLDILVQDRRDQAAAERFPRQVLRSCEYEPRVVITDKLASYAPAIRQVLPNTEHRRPKRLNNRAENSHLPTRKRERVLQRFKSAEHAQRFLGPFSAVRNHFRPRRHRVSAFTYRQIRSERYAVWQDVTLGAVRA